MNEIKCFGCGEKGKYYPYVPSKIYCFSCYDKIVKERDALRAENEQLQDALQSLFNKCLLADEQGELSELISGELLDSVGTLLGYTPENEIKKEREFLEAIKQALDEVTK